MLTPEQESAVASAYLGICILSRMCRKAGLDLARVRSEELLKEISEAFPEAYQRALSGVLRDVQPEISSWPAASASGYRAGSHDPTN